MKKIVSLMLMLVIAITFGCRQKKEEKSQFNYSPASAPSDLLMQIEKLQQEAKMAPRNAQVWTRLGDALMDSQRFAEAIDAYAKTLALEPKNVNVLVDQGTCYRGVGKFDKAVEQYRKALKIDPNFPNGHRNLGVVLSYDLHDNKEGIKEFQRYLELAPNAPDAESIRNSIRQLSAMK